MEAGGELLKAKKKKKDLPLRPQNYIVKGAFRRLFPRTGLYINCVKNALSDKKGVRGGKQYTCAKCGKAYGLAKMRVDHIEPVVQIGKTINDLTVQEIYDRIWCDLENLQVLCIECHDEKTAEEKTQRKQAKRGRNE